MMLKRWGHDYELLASFEQESRILNLLLLSFFGRRLAHRSSGRYVAKMSDNLLRQVNVSTL